MSRTPSAGGNAPRPGSAVGDEPPVIVCEKTGQWAAVLRGAMRGPTPRLSETRAYPACLRELDQYGSRAVVLELRSDKLREGLAAVTAIRRRFPAAKVFVVADRALKPLEWAVRELGAAHFVTSPRDPAPLLAAILRAAEKSARV